MYTLGGQNRYYTFYEYLRRAFKLIEILQRNVSKSWTSYTSDSNINYVNENTYTVIATL